MLLLKDHEYDLLYIQKLIFPAGIAFLVIHIYNEKGFKEANLIKHITLNWEIPFYPVWKMWKKFFISCFIFIHVILGNKEYGKTT